MLNITLRPLARKDLVVIWQYTYETWGETQADSYLMDLQNTFQKLASSPMIGRAADEVRAGLRIFQFKHHLIIYTVSSTSLQIVRVLHKRMDISQHKVQ